MKAKMGGGKPLFQVWMLEESDTIQGTARAYGERMVVEKSIERVAQIQDAELKTVMTNITELFATSLVVRDAAWFMSNNLISTSEYKKMHARHNELCAAVAPYALSLTDGFGVPENQFGPIAKNWEKYNVYHNFGERMANYPLEG